MRLRTRFSKTLPFVAIALSAATAAAQPVFTLHRSIELRTAQAQFVVRGTISHLARIVLVPPGGYATNSVRIDGHEKQYRDFRPDSEALYTITIKVDEIIKGPRRGTAEFVATTMASDD